MTLFRTLKQSMALSVALGMGLWAGASLMSTVEAKPPHKTPPGLAKQHGNKNVGNQGRGNQGGNWERDDRRDIWDGRNRFNRRQTSLLRDLLIARTVDSILGRGDFSRIDQRRTLPPGIAKNLQRGKPIPPGIRKQMVTLPYSVNGYLGFPRNRNYRVGVLNDRVILYSALTGVALDILDNFIN